MKSGSSQPQPVDLAFSTSGPENGYPVVLLHGFPLDRSMWERQTEALAAAGYRVVTPDLRGHGKSPPGEGAATMALMAKDVARLLVGLGLGKFALVGFSMGGYAALELCKEKPDRVAGLALVDTRAEPDAPETAEKRRETSHSIRRRGTDPLADKMMPQFFTEATRESRPELVESVRKTILRNSKIGAANALLGMAERADNREALARVVVPSLVVVGAQDTLTPPDAAKEMAEALPNAQLEVIEGAAHLTPLEKPEAVTQALLTWLEKVRPKPPA